jgi:hypothetical protein
MIVAEATTGFGSLTSSVDSCTSRRENISVRRDAPTFDTMIVELAQQATFTRK